jgi:hypothetical protein
MCVAVVHHRHTYETTTYPCDLLWGPGNWQDAAAWLHESSRRMTRWRFWVRKMTFLDAGIQPIAALDLPPTGPAEGTGRLQRCHCRPPPQPAPVGSAER